MEEGLSLAGLFEMFPDDDAARLWFERERWGGRPQVSALRFVPRRGVDLPPFDELALPAEGLPAPVLSVPD